VVVPGEVALQAVLDVGRRLEFVVLAGVDDEFRGSTTEFGLVIALVVVAAGGYQN
jgi:hypothetical protein